MRKSTTVLLRGTLVATTALAGAAHGGAAQAAPATGQATGAITGTIEFSGTAPDPVVLEMAADPFCLASHQGEVVTAETLVINDNGTVRWAFVYVKEGAAASSGAAARVALNQQGCTYQPHVMGMQAGGTVQITNSDRTLHNVNAQPLNNPGFNVAQPIPGMSIERSFPDPEVMILVRCDVHPWMQAFIGVVPHPFFDVSGEDGSFELQGLPAGDYVIEAWHETLGVRTLNVSVTAGQTATADFSFGADR